MLNVQIQHNFRRNFPTQNVKKGEIILGDDSKMICKQNRKRLYRRKYSPPKGQDIIHQENVSDFQSKVCTNSGRSSRLLGTKKGFCVRRNRLTSAMFVISSSIFLNVSIIIQYLVRVQLPKICFYGFYVCDRTAKLILLHCTAVL